MNHKQPNKHTLAKLEKEKETEKKPRDITTTMNLDRYLLVLVINKGCRIALRYEINMAN